MRRVRYPDAPLIPRLLPELGPLVLEPLDAEDLLRVRGTNATWDVYVSATLHQRIFALVRDGIDHYDNWVQIFEASRAVLGGIGAIHVLFPEHARPPFIELFVPNVNYAHLREYFLRVEKYQLREPASPPTTPSPSPSPTSTGSPSAATAAPRRLIDAVVRRRPGAGVLDVSILEKGGFTVFLIQSALDSPFLPITAEWHTGLFNYVGPRDIVCAYPGLTRAGRGLLNPNRLLGGEDLTPDMVAPAEVWRRMGWELSVDAAPWSTTPTCEGVRSVGCAAATRFFGDRHCIRGKLCPQDRRDATEWLHDDDEEQAYWWRGGQTCGPQCHAGKTTIHPGFRLCHPVLLNNE